MATSVNVGSSIGVTVTFKNASGGAATFNQVSWSFVSDDGGLVNITPAAYGASPPSGPVSSAQATVAGVFPGIVIISAVPDTNQAAVATLQVTVNDTSTTPATGTITSP